MRTLILAEQSMLSNRDITKPHKKGLWKNSPRSYLCSIYELLVLDELGKCLT